MKKLFLLIVLASLIQANVFSQGCLPEGITFTTQQQIDNFQINYPGCTEIEGNVEISGYLYMTNLNGLLSIKSIGGDLFISHSYSLTNLSGLDSLNYIGGVININHCHSLTNFSGLKSLFQVENSFTIHNNNILENFDGLETLCLIGGNLSILENSNLLNCSGLENLITIPGSLYIYFNPILEDLSGFEYLEEVDNSLVLYDNSSLQNLHGLNGITHIGEDLIIKNNSSLEALSALSNLTSIGDYLYIKSNSSLTNLFGLDSIQSNTINDLTIIENTSLQDCDIWSICQYLIAPNGEVEIDNNAPGCNSPEEVEEACLTSSEDISAIENSITIFPNPAKEELFVSCNNKVKIIEINIYNQVGRMVLHNKPTNYCIDLSKLSEGLYIIEIVTGEMKLREKLIIK